ncbi:MAG TPA: Rpn family recombination-promoting nuclease/putative transposase [Candidatus Rifleibacterium sp.]|nr:Rpn family recombination-promoting nuclease/putative transposase [Candidatus Rifleibacterium sp.]
MTKPRKLVSFDWAIKRLLRSKANFDILEGFLSELLKDDIKILSILESESNKDFPEQKANRLDLKVTNGKNEIVIIEIQYEREYDYFQRMLFATSMAVCEHLPEATAYSKVAKVISINILYFNLGHGKDYIYHGQTAFIGLNYQDELALSPEQQKMFDHPSPRDIFPEYYLIKVNNFNDVAKNTLDEWIYFLKNEEIKPGSSAKGLQQAKRRLDIMKLSEADRIAYRRHSYDLHYLASMALYSDYGIAKQEGREEGMEKGIEKGREETLAQTALKMLNKGISLEVISEITGLTPEQIETLRKDSNRVKEPAAHYKTTKKPKSSRKKT